VSEKEPVRELQKDQPAKEGGPPSEEPQKDQPANVEFPAGEPDKDQPASGHPSVEPASAAETTVPLPAIKVEPPPQSAINQQTASLPLIDLLAPRQPGSASGTPLGGMPGPAGAPGAGSAGAGAAGMPGLGSAGMPGLRAGGVPSLGAGGVRSLGAGGAPGLESAGMAGPGSSGGLGMGSAGMPGLGSSGVPVSQAGYPGGFLPNQDMAAIGGIGGPPTPPTGPGGLGRRGWLLAAGATGCVVVLGLIGWLSIGSLPTGKQPISSSGNGTATQAPPTSVIVAAGGYQFTRRSTRDDADCAANAYGKVSDFFRDRPCSSLRRALFTSSIDGRPVVVSVSTVTMPDEQGAAALRRLADTNGTGNVTDLLRAGVRVPSLPEALSDPSYTSAQTGGTVVIVESDYTEPSQRADDALKRIGEAAIDLGNSG